MRDVNDLQRILEKAGYWAGPMHQALNYLEHFKEMDNPKWTYDLVKHQAEGILGHFRMFNDREVYEFYKGHFDRIVQK